MNGICIKGVNLTFWVCRHEEACGITSFNKQTTEAQTRIVKNLTTWLKVYSQAFTRCKGKVEISPHCTHFLPLHTLPLPILVQKSTCEGDCTFPISSFTVPANLEDSFFKAACSGAGKRGNVIPTDLSELCNWDYREFTKKKNLRTMARAF